MESAFAASGATPASVTWSRTSVPHPDADTEEAASCLLRCAVMDASAEPVGKPFTSAAVELALASYPGFTLTCPPAPPTPYGVYRPAYVDRSAVTHTVVHADGSREEVPDPPELDGQPATGERQAALSLPGPHRRASPDGCRWARSSTPARATRAATPTSGCGSPTTGRRSTTPG